MRGLEAESQFGAEQVRLWRRSFREHSLLLAPAGLRDSFGDPRYTGLDRSQVPLGESLEDTRRKAVECWIDTNCRAQLRWGATVGLN